MYFLHISPQNQKGFPIFSSSKFRRKEKRRSEREGSVTTMRRLAKKRILTVKQYQVRLSVEEESRWHPLICTFQPGTFWMSRPQRHEWNKRKGPHGVN
jgi:hypothetical protein